MNQSKNQNSRYARNLIEATLDTLITINPDGKIMDVNEAMMKATDLDRDLLPLHLSKNLCQLYVYPVLSSVYLMRFELT